MTQKNIFLHPPDQLATRYVEWANWLQVAPKIDYGCILDKYLIPLHPGDLMAVVARPGHGKSSFMAYMARRTAQSIVSQNEPKKCVVYVTWEQSIEENEAFVQSGKNYSSTDLAWGRVDMDLVRRCAIDRVNLPVWMVGHSMADAGQRRPPLTVDMVYDTIRDIRYEYGYEPVLICLDYLQIIPVQGRRSRTEEVTEATVQAKQLALQVGVPIIAGVQASREVDRGDFTLPAMKDCQHSSAIEQTADKVLALGRPIKTMDAGESIEIGGRALEVNENLLVFKLLKQRLERGYGIWTVHFEPQTLVMVDYQFTKLEWENDNG